MVRKRFRTRRRPKGDFMPEDASQIMRQVILDPVAAAEAARDRYAAGQDNWRREKYEVLAHIFALGQYLKYHGSAWRRFIKSPLFIGSKRPLRPIKDQPKAMRIVAYVVLNANSRAKQDRAAAYVRGLQTLARRNVSADDVVEEIISAGGIDKLEKAAKTDPTRPQRHVPSQQEEAEWHKYLDLTEDEDLEEETVGAKDDPAARPHGGKAVREKDRSERGYDAKGRPTVELEAASEEQREGLLDLHKRRSAWIQVESMGRSKEGWRRLRILTVLSEPEM